jgi:hypothetical protein
VAKTFYPLGVQQPICCLLVGKLWTHNPKNDPHWDLATRAANSLPSFNVDKEDE